MSEKLLAPSLKLYRCPQWPTMQWVPDEVIRQLEAGVLALRERGDIAYRKDVLGLLALYRAPKTPEALWRMVDSYQRKTPPTLRGRRDCRSLMLTLPSPVSLRIDVLVERVRTLGIPVYRQDLIGALVLERLPEDPKTLSDLFLRYRQAQAREVAVRGIPLQRLLTKTRPSQGRRPMPGVL